MCVNYAYDWTRFKLIPRPVEYGTFFFLLFYHIKPSKLPPAIRFRHFSYSFVEQIVKCVFFMHLYLYPEQRRGFFFRFFSKRRFRVIFSIPSHYAFFKRFSVVLFSPLDNRKMLQKLICRKWFFFFLSLSVLLKTSEIFRIKKPSTVLYLVYFTFFPFTSLLSFWIQN